MTRTHYLSLTFALCCFFANSQEFEQQIDNLNAKIENSNSGLQLQWLDSLTQLIKYKSEHRYDSIANRTLNLALELDSLSIVSRQLGSLFYYYGAYEDAYEPIYTLFQNNKAVIERMLPKDRSLVYLELGDAYKYDSKNEEALQYLDSAYVYATKAGNKTRQANAKLYQAQIHAGQGRYLEAFEQGKIAEENFIATNNTDKIIAIKILLGVLKSQQEFFDEAEHIFKEGVDLALKIDNNSSLIILYNNLSRNYKEVGDIKNNIHYGKLALEASRKSERADYLRVQLLSQLVRKYCDADSLDIAKSYIDSIKVTGPIESMNLRDKLNAEKAVGYYYFKIGKYQEALNLWKKNEDNFINQVGAESQLDYEKFLAEIYEEMDQPDQQAIHLKNYVKLFDSLNTTKNRQTLINYQTKYETEKKNNTIETQQKDLELLEQKNKIKNQWILFGLIGLLGVFGIILLYRSRNNYKREQSLQANFSKKLLYAQEVERTRVAKELHDGVGQKLSLIKRKAENDHQDSLVTMASETLDEVRSISRALYPPMLQKLGLTKSISHLLLEIDEETELFVSSEIDDFDAFFNEEETLNFYRFIQESITNVIKHASAKTLMVNIALENNILHAIIKDNGKGFDSAENEVQNSLGLKTMSERIKLLRGKFSIKSNTKGGTIITATITK